ncbi:MAG TPA: GH3 auxin-responsive promoter family protein, partial [Paenisporosarcina sp.]|nr:GH3 auxin-responsive promoter family protein [Paenisporosarcina sp.]
MNREWKVRVEEFKRFCNSQKKAFHYSLKDPIKTQKLVLEDILSITAKTDFGKANNLSRVKDLSSLKKHVPIRTYEQFSPWINNEINKRGGVLSNKRLVRWLKTSGTTSCLSKKIPCTSHWLEAYRAAAYGMMWSSYLDKVPEILEHHYSVLDMQSIREPIREHLNGIPYQAVTNRNPPCSEADWIPPWYYFPWMSDTIPEGYENRMYWRLRYFIGQDLRVITAINPSTLVSLHAYLLKFLPQLIEDVRRGTLSGNKIFAPNLRLAAKLEQFDEKQPLTKLWSNLSLITCWTSSSAALYMPLLNIIFPGVSILPFISCGTEGIVTLPTDCENQPGVLAVT